MERAGSLVRRQHPRALEPEEPSGVRVHAMWSRFAEGTQETLWGLKGNKVTRQDHKIKTVASPLKGVRSFHCSVEVW